jgi:hypothetical protein
VVVPAVLVGAVLVLRRRVPGGLTGELLYVVLAYNVLLHGILIPEPRFMLPMRPVLFLLALAAIVELAPRLAGTVSPPPPRGRPRTPGPGTARAGRRRPRPARVRVGVARISNAALPQTLEHIVRFWEGRRDCESP